MEDINEETQALTAFEETQSKGFQQVEDMHQKKQSLHIHSKLRHVRWRWCALLLICCFVCGAYYSFDNPAELQTVL